MKGVIFTEFLDMVDGVFSLEMTEKIIAQCDLPSGGSYTATGTYDYSEIVRLVTALHKETDMPVQDLCKTYGAHLFSRFTSLYPQFFNDDDTAFTFIERVENYIHAEVLKLYPDAKVPSISCNRLSDDRMEVTYRSHRCLAPVCHGLILGCFSHFSEQVTVEEEDLSDGREGHMRFVLTRAKVN